MYLTTSLPTVDSTIRISSGSLIPAPRISFSRVTRITAICCPSRIRAEDRGAPVVASKVDMRSGKVANRRAGPEPSGETASRVMYSFQKVSSSVSRSPVLTSTVPTSNTPLVSSATWVTWPRPATSPPSSVQTASTMAMGSLSSPAIITLPT